MTRETKIGLLVGLAFLLVVGILLSEHITGATDRPAAPLADAGQGVGRGMGAPGAAVDQPKPAEPQTPVPTPQDLTPRPPVSQITLVPPAVVPANPSQTVIVVPNPVPNVVPQPPVIVTPPEQPANDKPPTDPFANEPLNKLANDHGQPLVPLNGNESKPEPKPVTPPKPVDAKPAVATAREYKAQPGDTLSRLASQVPGGNVRANRDAIVALNPLLQKDPNRVLSGRTYLLPTQAAARPAPAPQGQTIVINVHNAKPAPTPAPAPADGTRVYVVKPGDTLTKIAVAELGSKGEVPTLKSLNADVLKGTDVIKVNMKLKLPAARMLASVR